MAIEAWVLLVFRLGIVAHVRFRIYKNSKKSATSLGIFEFKHFPPHNNGIINITLCKVVQSIVNAKSTKTEGEMYVLNA